MRFLEAVHKLKRPKGSKRRLVVMDPEAAYGAQLDAAALPQARERGGAHHRRLALTARGGCSGGPRGPLAALCALFRRPPGGQERRGGHGAALGGGGGGGGHG